MDHTRWNWGFWAACLACAAVGCGGSGQTGSPAEEKAPHYQTSNRFTPELPDPGGPTGNPGVGENSNRPTYNSHGSDLAALLPSGHLVTAVIGRGVLVFDVSSDAPELIAELTIKGRPYQLQADGDEITLLTDEQHIVDEPEVPDMASPQAILRLIRIDLSDPTDPQRIAEVDLEGDVWQFVAHHDERFAVLAEHHVVQTIECSTEPRGEGLLGEWAGPMPHTMRVTDYAFDGSAFVRGDMVEVPTTGHHALATADGYFVPSDPFAAQTGETSELQWIELTADGLVEHAPIASSGLPSAVAREGDLLAVVSFDGSRSQLELFALDGEGNAALQGTLEVGDQDAITLLDGGQRALLSGASGQLIDLSVREQPGVLFDFPSDIQHVLDVGGGALLCLGASTAPATQGRMAASLWPAADPTAGPLSALTATFPWLQSLPGYRNYRVDLDAGLLLVPTQLANPGSSPVLGAIRIDTEMSAIAAAGVYVLHGYPLRPIVSDGVAYSLSERGVEKVVLDGEVHDEPSGGFYSLFDPTPIAQLEHGGYTLTLRERGDDGRYVLELDDGSGESQELVLDHRGDGLVAQGERVVVIGTRWDGECQFMDENPNPDGIAFDHCADYRGRGVSVIALGDEPQLIASLPISADMDTPAIDELESEAEWAGYIELPDGRLAFPVTRSLRCYSYASCEELGVEASESRASPGCSSTQDCSMLPSEIIIVSGSKPSMLLYVLDGAAGDDPQLTLAAEVEGRFSLAGEGPLDISWQLLPSADGFAYAREKQIYNEQGNSLTNEHDDPIVEFYLDRFELKKDGSLRALPSVNTPGLPIAWDGDNVYTVEPTYTDDGEVLVRAHRAALRDDAAYIEDSMDLGTRYLSARAIGDRMFVLHGPEDFCAEGADTDLFSIALDPDGLERTEPLVLPGLSWAFMYGPTIAADGQLLLRGGPDHYAGHAEIDIADPDDLEVTRYTTLPPQY